MVLMLYLPNPKSLRFTPMLSSESFMVYLWYLGLLKFCIQCEGTHLFFYMWLTMWPSTFYWKDYFSLIKSSWHLYQKQNKNHRHMDLFLDAQFYSIDMSIFMVVSHCHDYCCFVLSFVIGKYESFNFFLFKIVLAI